MFEHDRFRCWNKIAAWQEGRSDQASRNQSHKTQKTQSAQKWSLFEEGLRGYLTTWGEVDVHRRNLTSASIARAWRMWH